MTRFVVTGCGQSGTTYAAHLLTGCGFNCGHENVFDWDVGFQLKLQPNHSTYMGESSYVAAPFAGRLASEGNIIVHLVRPPLDQIRSVMGLGQVNAVNPLPWVQYLDHHIGLFDYPPGPERAAWYWLRWNEIVAPHATLLWRLGQIGMQDIADLCEVLDVPFDGDHVNWWLDEVPSVGHDHPEVEVTLDDLGELADDVEAAAARYGVPLLTIPPLAKGGIFEGNTVNGGSEDYAAAIMDRADDINEEVPVVIISDAKGGWYELHDGEGNHLDKVQGRSRAEHRQTELLEEMGQ